MKKSKVLSVVASATLVASMLLTACGNDSNNSSTPGSSTPGSSTPGSSTPASTGGDTGNNGLNLLPALSEAEQGKPGELTIPRSSYVEYPYADGAGITLTYWLTVAGNVQSNPATPDSVKDTQWAQLLQEKTGIKIEWMGPTSDATTAFNLMTTQTTLPDIIEWEWTKSYTGGPAKAYDDGVLIWLDDYISPDGPAADLWQFLQDNPSLDKAVRTDDGHYYCFPMTRGSAYLRTTSGPIVRQDLVEAAGYSVDDMVTIEDWTKILTAIKDQGLVQPDQSGIYRIITASNWTDLQKLLLPAWDIRPDMYRDYETGAVKYGYTDDNYKEFLRQMVAWKEAGLMDPDIISNNSSARQANVTGGLSVVTYGAGGGQIGTWNANAKKEPEKYGANFTLTGAQFPVLKAGNPIHYAGGDTDYVTGSSVNAVISSDCKYPEVAAAFLNYAYSEEGHYIYNFGIEGVDFTKNADGTITYSDWIQNNPDGLSYAVAMANKGRANMSGPFVQDRNYIIAYWNTDAQKKAMHMWNDETDVDGTLMPTVTLSEEESTEFSRIMSDINTAVKEYYSAVYNGQKDLDATWDEYVAQIEGMNIKRAIELEQAALERYNAR